LQAQAHEVRDAVKQIVAEFDREFNEYGFSYALESVQAAATRVDKFLSDTKPWNLAKDPAERAALELVLHTAVEAVRHFAVLLAPVLPVSAQAIWQQLGETGNVAEIAPNALKWGEAAGKAVGAIKPIFPNLDKGRIMEEIKQAEATNIPAEQAAPTVPTEAAPAQPSYITIDDFAKVELRVGQILTAEPVPKADKLLRFTIDLGEAEPRQIIAGIAQYYEPEKLIGRKVIVVANLAPRKLRGLESQGMILAAAVGEEGRPVLAGFLEDVPNGAKLR
jgi:methionyl-tRNA synthetase